MLVACGSGASYHVSSVATSSTGILGKACAAARPFVPRYACSGPKHRSSQQTAGRVLESTTVAFVATVEHIIVVFGRRRGLVVLVRGADTQRRAAAVFLPSLARVSLPIPPV